MDFGLVLILNATAMIIMYLALNARVRKALDERGAVERVRREITSLLVELNSATDRNVSLAEDRIAALRSTLAEVDKRIGVYDRESEKRKNEKDVYTRLGAASRRPNAEPHTGGVASTRALETAVPRDDSREIRMDRDAVIDNANIGARSADSHGNAESAREAPASRVPFVTFSTKPVVMESPLRERVLGFWKRGFTSDIIAARLGTTISEVDLIIQIEEQRTLAGSDG